MSVNLKIAESLEKLAFEHREADYHHHTYDEENGQYAMIRRGDPRALELGRRVFQGPTTGRLSDDPVRNYQYLFVASITLACRACIDGGMPAEDAYNLSDLYIRRADACAAVEEIFALHDAMLRDCVRRMQDLQRREVYSRPVRRCMDYIDRHLQQPLTVKVLGEALELSESYLSTLFRREVGVALSEYIRRKRVDTARLLLSCTNFSCVEIAEYLCFASDSHFSRVFRQYTGETPSEYRKNHGEKG